MSSFQFITVISEIFITFFKITLKEIFATFATLKIHDLVNDRVISPLQGGGGVFS